MDEDRVRAQRLIRLLQAKADRTDSEDEKDAIESKINDLRAKYGVTRDYPLPHRFAFQDENPFTVLNRDEFVRSFFGDRYPDHVTYFPTRSGKTYFSTWLTDMDPNPTANEEGWTLIDNSENEW